MKLGKRGDSQPVERWGGAMRRPSARGFRSCAAPSSPAQPPWGFYGSMMLYMHPIPCSRAVYQLYVRHKELGDRLLSRRWRVSRIESDGSCGKSGDECARFARAPCAERQVAASLMICPNCPAVAMIRPSSDADGIDVYLHSDGTTTCSPEAAAANGVTSQSVLPPCSRPPLSAPVCLTP